MSSRVAGKGFKQMDMSGNARWNREEEEEVGEEEEEVGTLVVLPKRYSVHQGEVALSSCDLPAYLRGI
ncbi:hypothetical protein E2C01_092770 [Portunus trituberculatus]|uniref:Uncharacterized protein n=1 Tax=Portunus trituberculatus TaxID=210409 RepID=A0A5B7JSS2_PORTR|nr:hypothetical protein [Portunus trituberculatus]